MEWEGEEGYWRAGEKVARGFQEPQSMKQLPALSCSALCF